MAIKVFGSCLLGSEVVEIGSESVSFEDTTTAVTEIRRSHGRRHVFFCSHCKRTVSQPGFSELFN